MQRQQNHSWRESYLRGLRNPTLRPTQHDTDLRAKFGGMDVGDASRLKSLEIENGRLKKLLAEAHLDIEALKIGLTVADDFTHECIDIAVDHGIGGLYVTRVLDQAACFRSYPQTVRTDNGPEFTSRAFIAWAQQHNVQHLLIQPGKPTQNGYIESFNGKFRDECLNDHWFTTLRRDAIANWRRDYNEVLPHSSCGYISPAKFAVN